MSINKTLWLSVLILVSGLILSSLVPGGPIENRDFSHISPSVLLVFNIYLTVLGLGSFLLAVYVFRHGRFARPLALWAGASWLVVYAIDLAGWFPQTPSPMSSALLVAEIAGLLLALPIIALATVLPDGGAESTRKTMHLSASHWLVLAASGALIVTFATWSAMQ